ncbi:MAG: hypothetical protein KA313_04745 [Pseudarcicella sp.]|nr:hypothetical protein [Pseudarcicella sp.]MBP6410387.1 hypothetical protein [Pseudarcicella sp.]
MQSSIKIFLALFLMINFCSKAQTSFGNEWINKDLKYFKINISAKGVYRISYAELKAAGMDVDNVNPVNLQMMHLGQKIAIWVEGEADGIFNTNDYLEFYAEANTGSQDSLLYRPITARANKFNSLFSKETYYYLVIGKEQGTRIQLINPAKPTNISLEPYHSENHYVHFSGSAKQTGYSHNITFGAFPDFIQSFYEPSEAWSGELTFIKTNNISKTKLFGWVKNAPEKANLEVMFHGRSTSSKVLELSLKGTTPRMFPNFVLENYSTKKFKTDLQSTDITADDSLIFNAIFNTTAFYNYFSVTYLNVKYPQLYGMYGEKNKLFYPLINSNNLSLINIADCPSNTYAYNISNLKNQVKIKTTQTGANLELLVSGTSKQQTLYVGSEFKKANSIKVFDPTLLFEDKHDFLILTHASLMNSSKEYAKYRSSPEGGSRKVAVVEFQSLYDYFTFGETNPIVVKKYLNYLDSKKTFPSYLLLIGRGFTIPDSAYTTKYNLVPSIGYPSSDILLSSGLKGFSENVPSVPTGRIPANTNTNVINYLNKVKEFERQNSLDESWKNNIAHISGGKTTYEAGSLRADMDSLERQMIRQGAKLNVNVYQKQNLDPTGILDISDKINNGLGMITFLGHSSATKAEIDLGRVSDTRSKIENKGKYPLMYYTGCSIGNCFKDSTSFATDWLFTPNKGSIAVLSNVFQSYQHILKPYMQNLYEGFFISEQYKGESLGKIQQITSERSDIANNPLTVAHVTQTVILGDPSLVIFPVKLPDYFLDKEYFQVSAKKTDKLIKNDDSLMVKILLVNSGGFKSGAKYEITINQKNTKDSVGTYKAVFENLDRQDTLFATIKKMPDLKSIEVVVDKNNLIKENNENNNAFEVEINGNFNTFPLTKVVDVINPIMQVAINGERISSGDFIAPNSKITVQLQDNNYLDAQNANLLRTFLAKCNEDGNDCIEKEVNPQDFIRQQISDNNISYEINIKDLQPGNYQLRIVAKDTKGNRLGSDYAIAFNIAEPNKTNHLHVFPNPIKDIATFELQVYDAKVPKQLELKIFDILGRELSVKNFTPRIGKNELEIDVIKSFGKGQTLFYTLKLLKNNGKLEEFKGKLLF